MARSQHERWLAVAGVALLVSLTAGCNDNTSAPTAADTDTPSRAATKTTQAPTQRQLQPGIPVRLPAGKIRTPEGFTPVMTVRVPVGWYGHGDSVGWGIGKGIDKVREQFRHGAIYVDYISMSMQGAVATFKRLKGLDVGKPTIRKVDGYDATSFHAKPTSGPVVLLPLGTGAELARVSDQQIFVDVAGETLLIRTELVTPGARDELARVLQTLNVSK